jgi:hypothetical protein
VVFTPDGKTLISGSVDNSIRLWNLANGKEDLLVKGQHNWIVGLALSSKGKVLASTDFNGAAIHLWDVATHKELHKLVGHQNCVHGVAVSPDGKTVASASYDQTVRLREAATGKEIRQLTGHQGLVFSVAFSRDGKRIASGGSDNTVRLWAADTGKELHKLKGHTAPILWVTFSPDDRTIASVGQDGTVRLWEVLTARERCTLKGHQGWVRAAVFSSDGKLLASGGEDGTARLWETLTGKELHQLTGHEGVVWTVAFSPDNKTVASGDERLVHLWDVARFVEGGPRATALAAKELTSLWTALAAPDAEQAYQAVGKLVKAHRQSVAFLQKQKSLLRKEKPLVVDEKLVARYIAQLDDDAFIVRERAAAKLAQLGKAIKPILVKALDETTSAEVGNRLRGLLKPLEGMPADDIRAVRAVEVLEWIADEAARKALAKLAEEGGALLKQEAGRALKRLNP